MVWSVPKLRLARPELKEDSHGGRRSDCGATVVHEEAPSSAEPRELFSLSTRTDPRCSGQVEVLWVMAELKGRGHGSGGGQATVHEQPRLCDLRETHGASAPFVASPSQIRGCWHQGWSGKASPTTGLIENGKIDDAQCGGRRN